MTNHTQPTTVAFDNRDIAAYGSGERRMEMRGFEPQYTDIVDYIIRITHKIWEEKAVGYIYDTYQHNCVVHGSGGDVHGREVVVENTLPSAFLLSLFGMFPDAGVTVDHLYWNGDDAQGYRVAVRWTLSGTHTGNGIYGLPSGARVQIMGLSHHHIKNGLFHKEYTVFDEMEILRRIALQRLRRADR